MVAFFFKNWSFLAQIIPLLKAIGFADHAFGFRISDYSKLDLKEENDNDARICQHDVIIKFI